MVDLSVYANGCSGIEEGKRNVGIPALTLLFETTDQVEVADSAALISRHKDLPDPGQGRGDLLLLLPDQDTIRSGKFLIRLCQFPFKPFRIILRLQDCIVSDVWRKLKFLSAVPQGLPVLCKEHEGKILPLCHHLKGKAPEGIGFRAQEIRLCAGEDRGGAGGELITSLPVLPYRKVFGTGLSRLCPRVPEGHYSAAPAAVARMRRFAFAGTASISGIRSTPKSSK